MSKGKSCLIEATVVTGFEEVAADEIRTKLSVQPHPLYDEYEVYKGHIFFEISTNEVKNLKKLQTIDNCYVVVTEILTVDFSNDNLSCLKQIRQLPSKINWDVGIRVWKEVTDYQKPLDINKSFNEISEFLQNEPIMDWWPNASQENPLLNKEPKKKKKKRKHEPLKEVVSEETETELPEISVTVSADQTSPEKKALRFGCNGNDGKEPLLQELLLTDLENVHVSSTVCASDSPPVDLPPSRPPPNPLLPTYRATCYRSTPTGVKHAFTSQDAAKVFGGAIHSVFEWNVNMTEFDLEVVLNVSGNRVWIGFSLTKESLHKRHIQHFGPTTLRPTIAMNLLKFSDLVDGETVCDPMCGGGSIPIEAAYEWPNVQVICGDNHEQAYERSRANIDFNNRKIAEDRRSLAIQRPLAISLLRWDVTNLPLKTESVDVFVTDLPFGKRSGTKGENRILYPKILNEMARVARRGISRAVFLTEDKNGFFRALDANQSLWWKKKTVWINIGGMWGGVFLLQRSKTEWKEMKPTRSHLKLEGKRRKERVLESNP